MRIQILTTFIVVALGAALGSSGAAANAGSHYTGGQKDVKICLPTTGSYTPEVCEKAFDPAGLCEPGEKVELDFCETYNPAPSCSLDGQSGQRCGCYYFCKKKDPPEPEPKPEPKPRNVDDREASVLLD